ncbi:DUF2059 domain-containing protein [Acinetobacter sp.]|uniref:DUF2059 domain-containing protein n=1 Tax=Acinetobacter sp. TaxID=472 RepID=UPI003751E312
MEKDFKEVVDSMIVQASEEDLATMREAIMQRFNAHHKKYIEEQISIYDKHLDEDVLDASIAFYTSKEGEQVLAKISVISEEVDKLSFQLKKVVTNDMMNIADEYDTN